MRISIITLNYNGSRETIELIKSLKDQTNQDFEIIIVDNASEEADFTNLKNYLTSLDEVIHSFAITPFNGVNSQVVKMKNSDNLGFSGGNNVGINQALKNGSEWIVLLNNDTWVEKNFIKRLRAILSVKTGVVGIPLIEGDKVAYCGRIEWLKPTLIHSFTITPFNGVNSQVYAIGGAVAIHKDVFDKIGLLDEKYFIYFEDADFSIRARKVGLDISIAYDINLHHHVSTSTKKLGSPLIMRYHYRNALYFNLKNGPWYIKLLVWPWSWIVVLKQLTKIAMNKNMEESKAILVGVVDFYKNKMGKIND